jgi:8-amino-7-oxononanoate synthase
MNVKESRKVRKLKSSKVKSNRSKDLFSTELKKLKDKKLLRKPVCISSSHGPKIIIDRKPFTDFSSNDYLSLSVHPGIIKAASKALKNKTFGSGASRLLSGTYRSHQRLEERLARFKKTDAALVFNSGYTANTGIIPALADNGTLIFSDELNHASIIDGIRLSRAGVQIYRHCDMGHLGRLLRKSRANKNIKKRLVVTDTVFSMDGDIAPLKDIVLLCKEHDAILMIDDAHATGVLGETGRGGLEHFGISDSRIVQMGTLSKAFGCYGGFAAGKRDMMNLLINRARSFIYSTSLPPVVCEAGIKAVDIMDRGSKGLRRKLWKNRARLFKGLNDLGFDTLGSDTPIIPVLVGRAGDALKLSDRLYRRKVLVPAIRPPTVPESKCRLRFSVTAGHTNDDIDLVLEALGRIK